MRLPRLLIIIPVLVLGLAPATDAASKRGSSRRGVLESSPLADGRIDLVVRSCARSVCKLVAEYVPKRGRRSSVLLQWGAASAAFKQEPAGGAWGAVDLLAPVGTDIAWASGQEDRYVSTSIRTVTPLTGGDTGVVVDQLAGFDHLIHAHLLLVVVDGTLREVKRWVGNGSPSVTALATTDDEVIFEQLFYDPDPANSDAATFTAYRWDSARARLVEQPRHSSLHAVVVEQYRSVAAARAAFNSAKEVDGTGTSCLAGMSVLPTSLLTGLSTGETFIGALTTRGTWADAAAASLRTCSKRWASVTVRPAR